MKKRDPGILIEDIYESILAIQEYTTGFDKREFSHDKKTQDAVFKRIENMGEATKRLPKDFKIKFTDIPWKKIAGMRDVLIHDYFGIDTAKVWNVIKNDIPDLEKKITAIDPYIGKQKKLLK
jgi:uncharacterized protein with HEPN domain